MPEAPSLTFYEHKESVCCHKVALTLAEKGITSETINISLENGEQKEPWFVSINPMGEVPVLVHNGRAIIQSTIIIEYLDDAYPDPALMPSDPYMRARRRLWARRIDDEMHSRASAISHVIAFCQLFRRRMDTDEKLNTFLNEIPDPVLRESHRAIYNSDLKSERLHQALRAFDVFLAEMETVLAGCPWLAGETYSLADIDVVPYIWRLSNLQLEQLWSNRPNVTDWLSRVTARPAFKSAIVDPALPEWIETMRTTGISAKTTLSPVIASFDCAS